MVSIDGRLNIIDVSAKFETHYLITPDRIKIGYQKTGTGSTTRINTEMIILRSILNIKANSILCYLPLSRGYKILSCGVATICKNGLSGNPPALCH